MAGLGRGGFADCDGLSGKAKERLDRGMQQMSRHFRSAFSCVPALLFSLSIFVNAAQREQPSFDCRKAATVPEKAICANAELSRLDVQLSRTWKTLLNAFSDSGQRTRMKVDERAWIARREKCGDDSNCIAKLYRDQISALTGADPDHRFSGVYEVKDTGSFALYPIGNRYLVSIQTADPSDGRWTCELSGEAESSGDDLKISVEGSVFQARLRDRETLIVGNTGSVSAVALQFCGLNGTFAFSYLRVRLNP
jgi:uncharacterized protein